MQKPLVEQAGAPESVRVAARFRPVTPGTDPSAAPDRIERPRRAAEAKLTGSGEEFSLLIDEKQRIVGLRHADRSRKGPIDKESTYNFIYVSMRAGRCARLPAVRTH
jgi:hypothetical protein